MIYCLLRRIGNIQPQNGGKLVLRIVAGVNLIVWVAILKYESPDGTKSGEKRYIELCNPFSRISYSFPRISNSFPRIGQLVLSDCNSFFRIGQPVISDCNSFFRIGQLVISDCNSFPRIGQLVLSDCNSFPRITHCLIQGNELRS